MAFARSENLPTNQGWSCGRSVDPQMALLKASVESQEWLACGVVDKDLISGSLNELRDCIDPRDIVRFHPNQYKLAGFPYEKFFKEKVYSWKPVINYCSNELKYVIGDQIYFPYKPGRALCYGANSSGCAAHTSLEAACQSAALEAAERDAFMITWVNQLITPTVKVNTLPAYLQRRIKVLEEQDFEVVIKDITLDLAPVVLVIAQNKKLTYTTIAAASSFDFEEMIEHALMEVESSVYCFYAYGSSKKISIRSVDKTEDHGKLYETLEHYQKADIYLASSQEVAMDEIGKKISVRSWSGFVDNLNKRGLLMYFADLSVKLHESIRSDLHIVKCIIPGVIPMSFGYREEPLGLNRIYQLPVSLGLKKAALSYRELMKFPHPFT